MIRALVIQQNASYQLCYIINSSVLKSTLSTLSLMLKQRYVQVGPRKNRKTQVTHILNSSF